MIGSFSKYIHRQSHSYLVSLITDKRYVSVVLITFKRNISSSWHDKCPGTNDIIKLLQEYLVSYNFWKMSLMRFISLHYFKRICTTNMQSVTQLQEIPNLVKPVLIHFGNFTCNKWVPDEERQKRISRQSLPVPFDYAHSFCISVHSCNFNCWLVFVQIM